ncbi:MAG: hypothetical protein HYZ75_01960 [Elusimicrobia bacterium]|nr:hypothetical protein [Elusimicrobiota bacterium]
MGLAGRRVLITSGPTREPLDPVRYLTNASSGKMGAALASAALARGASVVVVAGPGAPVPRRARAVPVTTALEMYRRTLAESRRADVVIAAAAVGDWRFAKISSRKIKRSSRGLSIRLVANPDIVKAVARRRRGRPAVVVGFALESHDWLSYAREKLVRKRLDLVVANKTAVLDSDRTRIALVSASGEKVLPAMTKAAAARAIFARIEGLLP